MYWHRSRGARGAFLKVVENLKPNESTHCRRRTDRHRMVAFRIYSRARALVECFADTPSYTVDSMVRGILVRIYALHAYA